MFKKSIMLFLVVTASRSYAQNDIDAIRYSRTDVGGTSRFLAMGGAFGAVGADLSCAAYNPAGMGLFRKGEISFSAGLRFTMNGGKIYNQGSNVGDANFNFNNFGIAGAWSSENDPDSRHVIGFTNSQIQNFNNSVRMAGYTNSSSIARDMLNLAGQKNINTLSNSYEGLGYDAFILNLDTVTNKFYSFVDLKRSVLQTRDIVTTGRVNELNISYAYSYKDQYYFGASVGIPRVENSSTTTHSERDDKDSMRIGYTSPNTYTTTYSDGVPTAYPDKLGFKSMTYTEYFKTAGSGLNLKLGGIARVNETLRIGLYYHTPTVYRLNDIYYSAIASSFDSPLSKTEEFQYPADGGSFNYRIITPGRLGLNAAFVIQKRGMIGIDYEFVNYKMTKLKSDNIADFAGVNSVITGKYGNGHNVRVGGELNLSPFMLRAGYAMYGSPFGQAFSGDFVRHAVSGGVGFRPKGNLYFDLCLVRRTTTENYFLFTTLNTKARLTYAGSAIAATIGVKF